MPEARIEAATNRLEALVAALTRSVRRQKVVLIALAVVTALSIFAAVTSVVVAVKASNTAHDVEANSEADLARVAAAAVEACQLRNRGAQVTRDFFNAYTDGVDQVFTSPTGHQAVAVLRASIPTPDKTDRDCNGNGLGDDDYPKE